MKILFVSDTYYPHLNGVYYFVCRIAPLLQENGHSVAVIAPSETMRSTQRLIDNIVVYGVPSLPVPLYPRIRFAMSFLLRRRLRALIGEFAPDVIHIQDHFLLARTVVGLNRRMGIPIMGTNHFMPENLTAWLPAGWMKRTIERQLWSRFSRIYDQLMMVTTPTETGARLIRPLLETEVVAVSSGIDLQLFTPSGDNGHIRVRYGIPDKPVLLFVGRLDPEKKLEDVLEVTALALRQFDFCLVIVGKGIRKKALENRAAALGIRQNVVFTGFVLEEDLPMIYQLSRCFIIASIAELLSLATLQAMASGLPVIAVRAGALELVHDRENGLLFDAGDIDYMVLCIVKIMRNRATYRQMGIRSLAYGRQHDIHACMNAFENIYDYLGHGGFWEVVGEPGPWVLASTKKN
jgi:glycosyltransferase involved in cell wall biosynthesis